MFVGINADAGHLTF